MAENLQMLREHIADLFVPDKHKRGFYQCPLCPSGHGGAGSDGAVSIEPDGIHAKCFSCGFYGDIFDWEAEITKKPLSEATRAVIARYDFSPSTGSQKPAAPATDPVPAAAPADFTAKLRLCADKLAGSPGEEYLTGRGFTQETMRRFMLGYDSSHYFKGKGFFPAVVLSDGNDGHYIAWRTIEGEKLFDRPSNAEAGEQPLFNAAALFGSDPVFVVESQLCAISIMQEGGSAVATSGAANHNQLVKLLSDNPAPPLLILSLDNDPTGKEQQEKLAAKLTAAGINFIQYNAAGPFKDPNEVLQEDPALLRGLVAAGYEIAENYAAELKKKALAAYEETSTAGTFEGFLDYLRRNADRNPVPTGFPSLDKILNGGLVPGLYIMGAVSSLGKTSLMVNFADNIAAAGTDVLYFSLEMSKYELMARSISRLSFSLTGKRKQSTDEAYSTFGILYGAKNIVTQPTFFNSNTSLLEEAMKIYRDGIGKHIWYFEGVGSIGVDQIRDTVRNHIAKTGRKPVVFIDYLQILCPPDPRATDKHNTDMIVTTLKQLSRDEDVPVPVNMAAFKESGAIEYGSDVLIGLQLYGIGYKAGETDKARKVRIQELVTKAEKEDRISIQVRVLKNRNGRRGDSGELKFTKRFNSFYEMPEDFKVVYSDENPFADDDDEDTVVMRR